MTIYLYIFFKMIWKFSKLLPTKIACNAYLCQLSVFYEGPMLILDRNCTQYTLVLNTKVSHYTVYRSPDNFCYYWKVLYNTAML